jgi:alpha-1,6-mannosyltransferase
MHLTNSWHENSGGVATFYRALIAEANRRQQPIRVVVPAEAERIEEVGEFGRIYHLSAPRSPMNPDYRVLYPSRFLFPGTRLQQILIAERPDLVEISDKYTLHYLAAVLRLNLLPAIDFRPTVVGTIHERIYDNVAAYLGRIPLGRQLCSVYVKWMYFPFFDHHVANSEYTAAELRAASKGQLVPRGTWIRPMGVDLSVLSPTRKSKQVRQELQRDVGGSDESVLLLYVGRLVPEKNLSLLFETFSHLRKNSEIDFRLLIAGEGMERPYWEKKCARDFPGTVQFLGHIKDRGNLADLYANADIFIHPNPREPFGIAPLEAIASGLPLVAPSCGGVSSYANSENAWVTEADARSFTRAIQEAVANPRQTNEKVKNAQSTVQRYSWESVAASFLDLYDEIHEARTSRFRLNLEQAVPGADFYSPPVANPNSVPMHHISQLAEKSFRLVSRLLPQSRDRRCPPISADPVESA